MHDRDGLLPIHTAAMKGRVHVLGELLDACSDSEYARTTTCQGDTILHLAVSSNRYEAVEFLVERLDNGELLNAQNEKGNTILHLAVARKQLQILKFLLGKREIYVNSVNSRGFTPLDVLLESPREYGDFELAEMIRKAGGIEAAGGEELQPLPAQSGLNLRNESTLNPRNSSEGKSYLHRIRKFFQASNNASARRRNNHRPKNNENSTGTLMVVATIIATITFQAGLSPPGGFNQDTGKVVLGNKLSLFLKFDMVGLFTSLSIILLLMCGTPRRKGMVLKLLVCIMWVSIFSTALAFLMAVFKIFPESNHPMVLIFWKCWLWIFRIAIIWAVLRSTICLLRKVGWLNVEEEDIEGQALSNPADETRGTSRAVTAKRIAALLLVIIVAAIVVIFVCLVKLPIWLSSMGLSQPETPQPPSPAPHVATGRMHQRINRRFYCGTYRSSQFDQHCPECLHTKISGRGPVLNGSEGVGCVAKAPRPSSTKRNLQVSTYILDDPPLCQILCVPSLLISCHDNAAPWQTIAPSILQQGIPLNLIRRFQSLSNVANSCQAKSFAAPSTNDELATSQLLSAPASPTEAHYWTSYHAHRIKGANDCACSTVGHTICNKTKNLAKISSEENKEPCQDEEWDSMASAPSAPLLSLQCKQPFHYSITDAKTCNPLRECLVHDRNQNRNENHNGSKSECAGIVIRMPQESK